MRFLGERERTEDPRAAAFAVGAALARAARRPPGPLRHEALAAALVRAGEVAQGLADREREAAEGDDGPLGRAAMQVAVGIARALVHSWRTGGNAPAPRPGLVAPLIAAALPERMRVRRAAGFAHGALYPEAWGEAAAALRSIPALTVVGIRSAGTGLAAMVAAGAGARRVPFTVRPTGPASAREVTLDPALADAVARLSDGAFALADEGPGPAGSSFAAVARALLARGVPAERIHVFPAHPGEPGGEGGAEARALYAALPRHAVSFESLLLAPGPLSLARLAEDAIGRCEGGPQDLGAGAWRARVLGERGDGWPPSQGSQERRKYLLVAEGRPFVARFAGLGAGGERKLGLAAHLGADGLAPAPVALRHGFLFAPWLDDARPLAGHAVAGRALREAVRRRLLVSAARPEPEPGSGASPAELLEMACENAAEALGTDAGAALRRLEEALPELERTARPCEVDGKMQAWEWLVLPDGRVQKADALDHHAAQDLAGCQDVLWDVAGAQLELGLDDREAWALAERVRAASPGADPAHLPFYRACLAALELARWSLAAEAEPPGPERGRRVEAAARYRRLLAREVIAAGAGRRSAGGVAHPSWDP